MSYPCICLIVCHIHGISHSSFNVTWYNIDFQLSYREWHVTGRALSYCGRRVTGCALCYRVVTSHGAIECHKVVLHSDATPRYAVTWLFTRKTPVYKTYTCQYGTPLPVLMYGTEKNWPTSSVTTSLWALHPVAH